MYKSTLNAERAKPLQTMRKLWLEETYTKLIKKMDIFHVQKTRVRHLERRRIGILRNLQNIDRIAIEQ